MESNSIQKLNFRKFLKSQAEAAKAQSFNTLGSFATRFGEARKGNWLHSHRLEYAEDKRSSLR